MINKKTTRLASGLYDGLFGVVDVDTWECRMFRSRQSLARATITLAERGHLYFTFYHKFAVGCQPNDESVRARAEVLEKYYPTKDQHAHWSQVKTQRDANLAMLMQLQKASEIRIEHEKVTLKQRLEQVYSANMRERYDDE